MLCTQCNELVTSQQLRKGSIVQLTEFVCNWIRERCIVIIIDLNVIVGKCDIIGDAKPFLYILPSGRYTSMAIPAAPIQSTVSQTYPWKTISQIKDEKLGTSVKPDWITVNATIWYINLENFCYTACPIMLGNGKCRKKVVNNGDGRWRCDNCDWIVDECDYRYILKLQIHDHTGLTWITAFQETAEEIMGVSAKDLYFMKYEEQDDDRFTETIRAVLHNEYSFKLKVKEERWGEEQRVKSSVVKAEKIKFSSHTKNRLTEIQKMQENPGVSSGADQTAPASAPAPSGIGQQGVLPANHGSVSSGGGNIISGASGLCYKCHKSGHWARDCPGGTDGVPSYGVPSSGGISGASGECLKCHQPGHWARDCPVGY